MSRFLPASLRARLALLALLPIVPALLLSLYTFAEQRHFAVNEAKAQALRLARQAATEQEQLLTGTRDLLIVVARQALASGLDPAGAQEDLERHADPSGGTRCLGDLGTAGERPAIQDDVAVRVGLEQVRAGL